MLPVIWALMTLHLVGCLVVAAAGDRWGRAVLLVASLPAVASTAWAVGRLGDAGRETAELSWVEGLDLSLAFSVGPLAALLTVVVSGIGVCVFVYSAGYFDRGTPGLGRFAATLSAFGTSMLGLVWADSVWTLFIFWELTSITSFLLVGHKSTDAVVRQAARRALLITVMGGLVLLAAFVLVVDATGTARLSEMGPVDGPTATVAAVLVLVAAATKSAQVPFHVWLPGAMAAPTPVSAYLHSATMVKAGVVLVALAAPVFTEVDAWKPLGLAFGVASMLWGAIGALRHNDAKLILAWGTVSQLGLMITLLSLGTAKATFAAISILAAHAVFKAALFMVVGEIDIRTGSRDIRELSGLWRSMPLAFAAAVVSGASMAGIPPLLGFPAKEAAIEAVLGLAGSEAWIVGGAIVVGSILTAAYTVRLLTGLFADTADSPTESTTARRAITVPTVSLGVLSVAGFVALDRVTDAVGPAATQVDAESSVYALLRWPGFTTALAISAFVVVAGLVLGLVLHRRESTAPEAVGAAAVDRLTDDVLGSARWLTGRVQHGSLPVYLVTMAGTAALATVPFAFGVEIDAVYAWDSPMQAVLAVLVVAAAITAAAVGSRLGAALGLGAVGLGVAGLFVIHGAPDLALTQLLVETVVVVGFVVGLGHLTRQFPPVGHIWRSIRIGVSALVGIALMVALSAAASSPVGEPPVEELVRQGADEGGGNNIVNVVLTDIRALDTLGEVFVLAVVAIGILALSRRAATAEPLRPAGEEART